MRGLAKHGVPVLAISLCGAAAMFVLRREPRNTMPAPAKEIPEWCEVQDASLELRAANGLSGDILIRLKLPPGVSRHNPNTGEFELAEDAIRPETLYTESGMLLRKESLIGQDRPPTTVYRFAADRNTLERAKGDDWIHSGAPVCGCAEQEVSAGPWLVREQSGLVLTRAGNQLETAGPHAVRLSHSPSGRFVAVVSANGEIQRPLVPFMGGGVSISGPFYHQVFDTDSGTQVGGIVSLGRMAQRLTIGCWTPDERYLVYSRPDFRYLCVVAVESGGMDR